ncbi:hypothetical protein Dimus_030003, partial [Dionaea muscipula]
MTLAGILGVPGNSGICEYIEEVWEVSVYCKPLEITKKFANNDMITEARRVKSTKMKPSERFLHFLVMKNVVPRFGKRDTTSFINLTYMDHLLTMVFKAFDVPLIDKQGEEPKRYDFFEETFLCMCKLKKENGVWWLGSGENRRRDNEEAAPAAEEGQNQQDFDWEVVIDEVELQDENANEEAEVQGESWSGEKLFYAEDEVQESAEVSEEVPNVPAPVLVQQKEKAPVGVDRSAPTPLLFSIDSHTTDPFRKT